MIENGLIAKEGEDKAIAVGFGNYKFFGMCGNSWCVGETKAQEEFVPWEADWVCLSWVD